MIFCRSLLAVFCLLVLSSVSCSQKKLSEQELRRQQELLTADKIRADLQLVSGVYEGYITASSGLNQFVRLNLDVRDVPISTDTSPDPVLTPKLVGNLRFVYNEETKEYIDAPIKAAEFFRTRSTLNIVVSHSQFGDLTINYVVRDLELTGNWNAPTVGVSGTSLVRRK